jgi:hypothetical protein
LRANGFICPQKPSFEVFEVLLEGDASGEGCVAEGGVF